MAARRPGMTYKRKTRCLQRLYGHHDEAPANGVEDAPGGCISCTYRDNGAYEQEVERVAESRKRCCRVRVAASPIKSHAARERPSFTTSTITPI